MFNGTLQKPCHNRLACENQRVQFWPLDPIEHSPTTGQRLSGLLFISSSLKLSLTLLFGWFRGGGRLFICRTHSDTTLAATLSVSSSSGQASRLCPKLTVRGSRKIWGTLRSTTVAAIKNAFKATKVPSENLIIQRKYTMTRGTSLEQKWWFVIKGNEEVLVRLQEEWEQYIGIQTTWKL